MLKIGVAQSDIVMPIDIKPIVMIIKVHDGEVCRKGLLYLLAVRHSVNSMQLAKIDEV